MDVKSYSRANSRHRINVSFPSSSAERRLLQNQAVAVLLGVRDQRVKGSTWNLGGLRPDSQALFAPPDKPTRALSKILR